MCLQSKNIIETLQDPCHAIANITLVLDFHHSGCELDVSLFQILTVAVTAVTVGLNSFQLFCFHCWWQSVRGRITLVINFPPPAGFRFPSPSCEFDVSISQISRSQFDIGLNPFQLFVSTVGDSQSEVGEQSILQFYEVLLGGIAVSRDS